MSRIAPIALDLFLVLVFAVIGRISHGLSLAGIFATAWPFLIAALLAWVVLQAVNWSGLDLRSGLLVWLVTLCVGIGLRLAAGHSAAVAFVVISALFLGGVLCGWRLVAWLVRRRAT